MRGDHGHGVRYLFRAQFRRRWLPWTAMGVLVGVVAGAVMAAAIGSLRVDSAADRFFAESNAFDVGVVLACDTNSSACLDQVLALPGVEDGAEFRQVTQVVTTVDGEITQPTDDDCYSGPGQVLLGADPEGRFGTDVNRIRLLEGRLPAADAAHEVVIAPEMASRLDLHPGDRLVSYPDSPDCLADDRGDPFALDIVGVGVAPFLVRPPTGEYFNLVIGSPALLDEVPGGGSYGLSSPSTRVPPASTTSLPPRRTSRSPPTGSCYRLDSSRTSDTACAPRRLPWPWWPCWRASPH